MAAVGLYRQALAASTATHGASHPDTLTTSINLASTLTQVTDAWHEVGGGSRDARLSEAEGLYRAALEAQREALGDGHQETLATASGFAALLHSAGKLRECEALLRWVLGEQRASLGSESSDTLVSVNNLAAVLRDRGAASGAGASAAALVSACALYKEACAACASPRNPALANSPLHLAALTGYARVLALQRDYASAILLYEDALVRRRGAAGGMAASPPALATTLYHLGLALRDAGDLASATYTLEETLQLQLSLPALGPTHSDTARTREALETLGEGGGEAGADPVCHPDGLLLGGLSEPASTVGSFIGVQYVQRPGAVGIELQFSKF